MVGSTINTMSAKQIYAGYGGATPGVQATGPARASGAARTQPSAAATAPPSEGQSLMARAAEVGSKVSAIHTFVVLLIMLFLLMYGARKLGSDNASDFANLKPSFYNVLVISFASIIGTVFFKTVFTRFPIPGISTVVMAA